MEENEQSKGDQDVQEEKAPLFVSSEKEMQKQGTQTRNEEDSKKIKKTLMKLMTDPYQTRNHIIQHPEAEDESNAFDRFPPKVCSQPLKILQSLINQISITPSSTIALFPTLIFISQFLQIIQLSSTVMKRQTQVKELDYQYRDYLQNGYSLPINTQIGDYTIKGEIGVGAFGKIYHAKNKKNQDFALKVMDIEKVDEERNPRVKEIKKRLLENEPKLMQLCNSPNVLKCFQIFANDSLKILVLEYCNGKTLQHYLDQKRKIPEDEAVKILRQIINGIAELHNHNIIHRDLKADNIMEHEGEYKIIDLGFSKKLDIINEQAEVQGTILGTVTTMAPEVLAKLSYGLKADIWSIGVIFFQMVFGVYLYDSVNARQRYKEIEQKRYFSPDKEFTFSEITISKNANNFLYQVLEVNTQKRIGWRELLEHPLIKKQEGQKISDRFLFQRKIEEPVVDLNIEFKPSQSFSVEENEVQKAPPLRIEENIEKKQVAQQKPVVKPKNRFKIDINQQNKEKSKFQEKLKPIEEVPVQYDRWSVQLKKQEQIRREQRRKMVQGMKPPSRVVDSEQYKWVKLGHLQCLKTELIYYQIIVPLENQKLLNFSNRDVVEFMYLITARCFNNMSPISDKIAREDKKSNIKIRNLYQQVQELYKKVHEKFIHYGDKLTAIQNSFWQIFTDFFRKRFLKNNYEEKSNYTSGIQSSNNETEKINEQYGDYNKKDQIQYTQTNYIGAILNQLAKSTNSQKVATYLRHYTAIMTVTLAELEAETFREYVIRIISS